MKQLKVYGMYYYLGKRNSLLKNLIKLFLDIYLVISRTIFARNRNKHENTKGIGMNVR